MLDHYKNKVPYTFALDRDTYNKYYSSIMFRASGESYVGVKEKHKDMYIHYVKDLDTVTNIINEHKLKVSGEDNCMGAAVYTYPVKSGRYIPDYYGIIFTTSDKHVHIFDSEDSNHSIGECNFLNDIVLETFTILTEDKVKDWIRMNWDSTDNLNHYYGIDNSKEKISIEDLPEYIDYHRHNKHII